ncbi:hypothetical protein [Sharpea azabuensis]|uniref:hypothetical protein n=1 Tax=Sharpea azabuensis TaxID=322505 RepID=UPI00051B4D57|nr:hypothetical protein [Sharpea azabuensis]
MRLVGKLLRLVRKREIVLLIILLAFFPVVVGKRDLRNFMAVSLYFNYPTLIINNIFLVILYKKMQVLNRMQYMLITRVGLKRSKLAVHGFVSLATFVLMMVLYGLLMLLYGTQEITAHLVMLFLIESVLYFLEANIIALQFHRQKQVSFVIIAIIINLGFHYIFVL